MNLNLSPDTHCLLDFLADDPVAEMDVKMSMLRNKG